MDRQQRKILIAQALFFFAVVKIIYEDGKKYYHPNSNRCQTNLNGESEIVSSSTYKNFKNSILSSQTQRPIQQPPLLQVQQISPSHVNYINNLESSLNRPIAEEEKSYHGFEKNSEEVRIEGEKYDDKSNVVQCSNINIQWKKPIPKKMEPTLVASYPGSGAKLTWKLIRAITGIMTGDDVDHNGLVRKGQVVAIKTHYPTILSKEKFEATTTIATTTNDAHEEEHQQSDVVNLSRIERSILLLRSPFHAIPSYYNFQYERSMNLENHST